MNFIRISTNKDYTSVFFEGSVPPKSPRSSTNSQLAKRIAAKQQLSLAADASFTLGKVLLATQILGSCFDLNLPHAGNFIGSCSSLREWSLHGGPSPQLPLCLVARYFSAHRCFQILHSNTPGLIDSSRTEPRVTLSEQKRAERLSKAMHLLAQNVKRVGQCLGNALTIFILWLCLNTILLCFILSLTGSLLRVFHCNW